MSESSQDAQHADLTGGAEGRFQHHFAIEVCIGIGMQLAPGVDGAIPVLTARRERPGHAGVELEALAVAVVGGTVPRAAVMHHAIAIHEAALLGCRIADAAGPAALIDVQAFIAIAIGRTRRRIIAGGRRRRDHRVIRRGMPSAMPFAAYTVAFGVIVLLGVGEFFLVICLGLAGAERFGNREHNSFTRSRVPGLQLSPSGFLPVHSGWSRGVPELPSAQMTSSPFRSLEESLL